MNMKRIALALSTAAIIGAGYFSFRAPTLKPDTNVAQMQKSGPKRYRWRKGESWITDGRLYFSYRLGKKPSIRSVDINRLHIKPDEILAYGPGEAQSGILITKTGFHLVKGAEDAHLSSEGYKPETDIIQMEKDISGLRRDYGDFIAARVKDRVAYILTEQGVLIENNPDKDGWIVNRLLDSGRAEPQDSEILINGKQVSVRIGMHLFFRGPGNVFRLRENASPSDSTHTSH